MCLGRGRRIRVLGAFLMLPSSNIIMSISFTHEQTWTVIISGQLVLHPIDVLSVTRAINNKNIPMSNREYFYWNSHNFIEMAGWWVECREQLRPIKGDLHYAPLYDKLSHRAMISEGQICSHFQCCNSLELWFAWRRRNWQFKIN